MANKEIQRYKDNELLKWCKDLIFLRSDYPCKHLVISMTKLNFEEFQHQKLTTWKTIFFFDPNNKLQRPTQIFPCYWLQWQRQSKRFTGTKFSFSLHWWEEVINLCPSSTIVKEDTWWQCSMWRTLGEGQLDAAGWGDDSGASW